MKTTLFLFTLLLAGCPGETCPGHCTSTYLCQGDEGSIGNCCTRCGINCTPWNPRPDPSREAKHVHPARKRNFLATLLFGKPTL